MKFLFYFLLSLNVVFFLWEYYGHSSSGLTDEALLQLPDPAIERILLVSEIRGKSKSPRPAVLPAGTGLIHSLTCNADSLQSMDLPLPEPVEPLSESLLPDLTGFEAGWKSLERSRAGIRSRDSVLAESPGTGEIRLSGVFGASGRDDSKPSVRLDDAIGTTVQPENLCYKLGPRLSSDAFLPIVDRFRRDGVPHSIKAERVDVETSFIVYYPAAESPEASKANVQMLSDKGLRDLWLIDKGDMRGNISLGVFKTRSRAEVLQQELEAKQIQSQIQAQLSSRTEFHLVFRWPHAPQEIRSQLLRPGFDDKELTIGPAGCDL